MKQTLLIANRCVVCVPGPSTSVGMTVVVDECGELLTSAFQVSSLLPYLIPNYCWEWNPNLHFSIPLNIPKRQENAVRAY
jgi:hypothetical protein